MALYIGSSKQKVVINGVLYCLNLYHAIPITNSIKLLSSDDYILTDINGLYLTIEEGE